MKLFLSGGVLLKISFPLLLAIVFPPSTLLIWLGCAMVLDLITGIAKAIKHNIERTSTGYRKTVAKFIQYGGAICIGIVLANVADYGSASLTDRGSELVYKYFSNSMIMFIIFIEIKSILENLIEVSPESDFTKRFLKPVHKVVSFDFKAFFAEKKQ